LIPIASTLYGEKLLLFYCLFVIDVFSFHSNRANVPFFIREKVKKMENFNALFLVVFGILLLAMPYACVGSEYIEGEVLVVLRDKTVASSADKSQQQSERAAVATDIYVRNIAGEVGAVPIKT
jgi:hypothetical protein